MIDETKEAKKYKEKQEDRRYVWHYNLNHAPTYARAYFKRELEQADKIFARREADGEDVTKYTKLDHIRELIMFTAEQLDLYGYDMFKMRFND